MNFRIADTFTDSLAWLTGEEQKAVKTAAFDLQLNPANPSMSFHKLAKARDKNFWSVRVGSDIRLIVHKSVSGDEKPRHNGGQKRALGQRAQFRSRRSRIFGTIKLCLCA